jgi:DNA-binding NarL/FixJ family response regulator
VIRIVIVDDHAIVREGLKHIVEYYRDISVEGEASCSDELLEILRKKPCDVVLLDIKMPGRDGLDVLKDVRKLYPRLPVLVLSMYQEEQYGVRALSLGAAGYLTKGGPPSEVVHAVRKIASGGKYVGASLAERLAVAADITSDHPPHESLSDREFTVLRMAASGKTPSEIADELALSIKTISSYRARVLRKLNATNFMQVVRYAIENHLVE